MVTFNGKSLAKMAKGNTVAFDFYRKGELWYKINVDGKDFSFPFLFRIQVMQHSYHLIKQQCL